MTPYGNIDLNEHWLKYWLVAWWHQDITWINIDFSLLGFCGIHMRAISSWAWIIVYTLDVCFDMNQNVPLLCVVAEAQERRMSAPMIEEELVESWSQPVVRGKATGQV